MSTDFDGIWYTDAAHDLENRRDQNLKYYNSKLQMAAVLKIGFWPNCAASSFVLCTRDRVNNGQIAKKSSIFKKSRWQSDAILNIVKWP